MAKSPVVILFDSNGNPMSVEDGVVIPANTTALLVAGTDGANAHVLLVDAGGRPIIAGAGVAGTPAGGVISVQGVAGGSALPVSGSVTASNASIGANGAAAPTSATQVGGTDGANLQPVSVFDADTGAGTQYVLGAVLRKAASGGSVEAGTSSDPLRIDPTGTTTQPVSDSGGSLTVDTAQLPGSLVGGRLDANLGSWFGSAVPTIGQKSMASSVPVVISSDQATFPVTATFSASDATATATFDSLNDAVTVAMVGQSSAGFQFLSGMVGAIVPEVSFDNGTTWVGCVWYDPATGAKYSGHVFSFVSSNLTRAILGIAGASHVRVRVSNAISGSSSVFLRATSASDSSLRSEGQVGFVPPGVATQMSGSDGSTLRALKVGADGTLAANVAQWLGSTAPTVGQKTASSSIPVVLASDSSMAFGVPDANNSTSTPLGIGGNWLGTFSSAEGYSSIQVRVLSDVASNGTGLYIIWAADGTGTASAPDTDQAFGGYAGGIAKSHQYKVKGPFYRLGYINGGVAQSTFSVTSVLKAAGSDPTVVDGQNVFQEPGRPAAIAGYDGVSTYRVIRTGTDGNIFANRTATSGVGALNGTATLSVDGLAAVGVRISGTWSATLTFEGTIDGTNFFAVPAAPLTSDLSIPVLSTVANGQWSIAAAGFSAVRVRASAYTSGSATVTLVGTPGAAPTLAAVGQVTSYGTLKVTGEGSELFAEPFDGGVVDVTNRWTQFTVGGGTVGQANGTLTVGTGTTASNAGALTSQNQFRAIGLGFQVFGASLKLEASALTNNHRFWGLGTEPVSWAAATPIQEGVGFEQDTTGALNAVTYSAGVRTIAAVLGRPSDGNVHRYAMYVGSDQVFWYLDTLEYPIASSNWPPLGQQTLPIRLHSINHTSGPSSAPTFQVVGVGLTETSHSGVQISDGTFAWRKATVKPASTAAVAADSSLVVALSPNINGQKTSANSVPVVISSDQTHQDRSAMPPGTKEGIPVVGQSSGVGRIFRTGRFGHTIASAPTLLASDCVEGSTVNSWLWTQSAATMTIAQATGVLTLNNSATTTASTHAIVTCAREFPIMDKSPIMCTFTARVVGTTNAIQEIGLGAPTGTTAVVNNGAFFRVSNLLQVRVVTSFDGAENVSAVLGTLSSSSYYTFHILLESLSCKFIVEDSSGVPIVDTAISLGVTTPSVSAVSHLPAFARTYTTGVAGVAPVIRISSCEVWGYEANAEKPYPQQQAGSGRWSNIDPTTFAQTTQLAAGAAATLITPNSTGGTAYSTLGGEFALNATASSENLLGVFGFLVPSPYTLYVTDIALPQYTVRTALGATVSIHNWALMVNASSNNPSSATGFRLPIGTFTVAASAAIGAIFNGQPLLYNFGTPLVIQPGKRLLVLVKAVSGPATGSYRGNIMINGFFE